VHYRRGDERPGQTNGVPLLHSVLQDLHDFDLLMLASMKRSQVAACLSMFITSSAADEDLLPLAAEDYGYVLKEKLEPGGIMRLFPGEQAQFLSPNMQVPELAQLAMLIARRIGAGVGISPQAVLRIWEGLTYSAARTVMIDDDKTFDADRVDLVDEVLAWEWRLVHEDALLRGDRRLVDARVTIADLDLVRWIAQKRPWVDPKNEAEAIKLELEMGLTTVAEECARRGRDWREVIRQRLEVEAYTRELEAQASLDVSSAGGEGDESKQVFAYHLDRGVVRVNEARAQLGLSPVPGGDVTIPEWLASLGVGLPTAIGEDEATAGAGEAIAA
jgi:lambda family phage portal protein